MAKRELLEKQKKERERREKEIAEKAMKRRNTLMDRKFFLRKDSMSPKKIPEGISPAPKSESPVPDTKPKKTGLNISKILIPKEDEVPYYVKEAPEWKRYNRLELELNKMT